MERKELQKRMENLIGDAGMGSWERALNVEARLTQGVGALFYGEAEGSRDNVYLLKIDAASRRCSCQCEDFKRRKHICKHLVAFANVILEEM